MECNEASTWIDAYIDHELDPAQLARFEDHALRCAHCAPAIDQRRQLRDTLARAADFRAAPAAVRASVMGTLGLTQAATPRMRTPSWAWASLAASIALAGLCFWLALGRMPRAPTQDLVLRDAISSHIRSLMASHLADVAVSDQHTVKPWFAGKLDFSPPVTDYAAQGFPLAGGRLDYIAGRPVAAVVYNRRAHVINLFASPDPAATPTPPRATEDRGYHAISWSNGSMQFCAVSDVNADELAAFVELVRSHP